ncbi:hypothetical protein VDGL01_11366 [Verticillium dahliae]
MAQASLCRLDSPGAPGRCELALVTPVVARSDRDLRASEGSQMSLMRSKTSSTALRVF